MLPNKIVNNKPVYETAVINEQAEAMLTQVAKNVHEVKHQLVLHMLQANMQKENGIPQMQQLGSQSILQINDLIRTEPIGSLYMLLHELGYTKGLPFTADDLERQNTIEKIG
jgi:hypothetical protein